MKNPQRAFHSACASANAKAEPVIEYRITLKEKAYVP